MLKNINFKCTKKKALSPLIATILLVAIALSLAGILYSWASQNARDTTGEFSDETQRMLDCKGVNLTIESCDYNSDEGVLSFILFNRSTITLSGNLNLTVIDANNEIVSSAFAMDFTGDAMSIDTSDTDVFDNSEDYSELTAPLTVRVTVSGCPDHAAQSRRCGS